MNILVGTGLVVGVTSSLVFGIVRRFRARAVKQLRMSMDAYAEREIARERRKQTRQRAQAFFTLLGADVPPRSLPDPRARR